MAPHVARLLDVARDVIMTSDDAALLPVYPCLVDVDNLTWSRRCCRRVIRYARQDNQVLLEVDADVDVGRDVGEPGKYVLIDLNNTHVRPFCTRQVKRRVAAIASQMTPQRRVLTRSYAPSILCGTALIHATS